MRKKSETKVALEAPDGTRIHLGVPHAERLLDMGPELNGGYTLPADSGYVYDVENGLRPAPSAQRGAKRAEAAEE